MWLPLPFQPLAGAQIWLHKAISTLFGPTVAGNRWYTRVLQSLFGRDVVTNKHTIICKHGHAVLSPVVQLAGETYKFLRVLVC